jgi:hypothetical protein
MSLPGPGRQRYLFRDLDRIGDKLIRGITRAAKGDEVVLRDARAFPEEHRGAPEGHAYPNRVDSIELPPLTGVSVDDALEVGSCLLADCSPLCDIDDRWNLDHLVDVASQGCRDPRGFVRIPDGRRRRQVAGDGLLRPALPTPDPAAGILVGHDQGLTTRARKTDRHRRVPCTETPFIALIRQDNCRGCVVKPRAITAGILAMVEAASK